MKTLLIAGLTASTLFAVVGCTGENAKDATAAVVGKGIEVGKGTFTGIAAGVDKGRKQADSADGAVVISNTAELEKSGAARVAGVTGAAGSSVIAVIVENNTEKPMRATGLDVIVLDSDGVVTAAQQSATELTIPPKAKAKLEVTTSLAPEKVGTVRLYGKDLPK